MHALRRETDESVKNRELKIIEKAKREQARLRLQEKQSAKVKLEKLIKATEDVKL